jgi:hypothetical protein
LESVPLDMRKAPSELPDPLGSKGEAEDAAMRKDDHERFPWSLCEGLERVSSKLHTRRASSPIVSRSRTISLSSLPIAVSSGCEWCESFGCVQGVAWLGGTTNPSPNVVVACGVGQGRLAPSEAREKHRCAAGAT